jgi:hypothetical protein
MEKLGVHKRWKHAFLIKELEKRVLWPEDRPDIKAFHEDNFRELLQFVGDLPLDDSAPESAIAASVTLRLHGLRLLREATYALLRGESHSLEKLNSAAFYEFRALQIWQARNIAWVSESRKPHNSFKFDDTGYALATAFALGWMDIASKLGKVTLQMLPLGAFNDADPFLSVRVEPARRCFAWFTLKLFADWSGQALPEPLSRHPYPSPPYDALLACWRDPDPANLIEPLLAVCDWHTHEAIYSRSDKPSKDVDFGLDPYMGWPIEVHMVYRLRESLGLTNPAELDHPLMKTALAPYLPAQPVPKDDLLDKVTARALTEYPTLAELL